MKLTTCLRRPKAAHARRSRVANGPPVRCMSSGSIGLLLAPGARNFDYEGGFMPRPVRVVTAMLIMAMALPVFPASADPILIRGGSMIVDQTFVGTVDIHGTQGFRLQLVLGLSGTTGPWQGCCPAPPGASIDSQRLCVRQRRIGQRGVQRQPLLRSLNRCHRQPSSPRRPCHGSAFKHECRAVGAV